MFSKKEEEEFLFCNKDLCKVKKENPIVNSLLELYYQLYHEKCIEEKSLRRQKVIESIESGIWCCQMVSLLWIPNLSIANWNKNREIWEIIGYSRLDNICSVMNLLIEFFYFSIAVTLMLFLGISALVFTTYCSFNLPRLLFDIFKWIFNLWTIAIFLPSMVVYSIFLKYNFLPQNYILQYKDNNDSKNFEISTAWQTVTIFAMIINFFLILFHTEFSGEIRHSIRKKIIKARAHSIIDLHKIIFTCISATIYSLYDENNIIYFQLFEILISISYF